MRRLSPYDLATVRKASPSITPYSRKVTYTEVEVEDRPPQRSLNLVYQPEPGEVLAALKDLAVAYRRATGLEGAYDPAIRNAERILTSTTSGV